MIVMISLWKHEDSEDVALRRNDVLFSVMVGTKLGSCVDQ